MRARPHALGQIVRVLLCAATMLAILGWLAISGIIWMSRDGLPLWPTFQFVAALGGQASLLVAFLSADDGHRLRAARLAAAAAIVFVIWLLVLDAAGLWAGISAPRR
jgi:hypothetical protein